MKPTIVREDSIETPQALYLLGAQPNVYLLHATPEWVIAQATEGYTGLYSNSPMTADKQDEYWAELGATALKGPLEMATTFWLIKNVTRAFTHQLARYRMGTSMVQESQRFSIQVTSENHVAGNRATIMVPQNVAQDSQLMEEFITTCEEAMTSYHTMIKLGIDVQDARAILPTHICTRLYLSINVSSLVHVYRQRTCCQAQAGEWDSVMSQMKTALGMKGFEQYFKLLKAPYEDPNCISCGFGANFDRFCKHQSKFDVNLVDRYSELDSNVKRWQAMQEEVDEL